MIDQDSLKRAEFLLEAFPYIQRFSGQVILVKYGGSLMVDDDLKMLFAQDIALMKLVGLHPVIVHGGGKEISKWMKKLGKKSAFIDGLRVTDVETLEITEMVLSGKINSDIVSNINASGGKAVGLSGKDGLLFTGKKKDSKKYQELGFVGDIVDVDTTLLLTLSNQGYIPVISSIGQSVENSKSLNMNADHVSEQLAVALLAKKLIFLTDVDGLVIDGKFIPNLSLSSAEVYLKHPDVKGGMLPKLSCAIDAIKNGVEQVHMLNGMLPHVVLLELFTDSGIGTMLSK